MKKLYVAYGSNLNILQMAFRCPSAKPVGTGFINDYKLAFRNVATIEPCTKKKVPVAVWEIDARAERALDIYEGYPNYYRKEDIDVEMDGKIVRAMVYLMNYGEPNLPNPHYLQTIETGYQDFKLDKKYLVDAIQDTSKRIKNKLKNKKLNKN